MGPICSLGSLIRCQKKSSTRLFRDPKTESLFTTTDFLHLPFSLTCPSLSAFVEAKGNALLSLMDRAIIEVVFLYDETAFSILSIPAHKKENEELTLEINDQNRKKIIL